MLKKIVKTFRIWGKEMLDEEAPLELLQAIDNANESQDLKTAERLWGASQRLLKEKGLWNFATFLPGYRAGLIYAPGGREQASILYRNPIHLWQPPLPSKQEMTIKAHQPERKSHPITRIDLRKKRYYERDTLEARFVKESIKRF